MKLSNYTILSPLRESENWFILNLLTGQADILEPEMGLQVKNGTISNPQPFIEKGYIMDEEEERSLFNTQYLDFKEQQEKSEIQIFYVPTYQCNFACSYCYQEGYDNPQPVDQKDIIQKFFSYLDEEMAGHSYYVTLFGGEPLLPDKRTMENIDSILDEADKRDISLAIVTNGYTLEKYLPRLVQSRIREVQVTLDGVGESHNIRRPLKGGQPTFERIAENISQCLDLKIPVNLRVVLDKQNLTDLPTLAQYAINAGWTESPLFKTQLGRNYELHACQINHENLYSRVEMYEALYLLMQKYPWIEKFHTPAFSLSRFLKENGELPQPLFDSCPAAKTEWAFDYTGKIYPCTAMVGKVKEELGSFYPEKKLLQEKCDIWQDRDVLSIPECQDCNLQLACGGGCGAVSKNKTGNILSADCRPVQELMGMGLSLYFNQGEME